jgi:hypothetical protein
LVLTNVVAGDVLPAEGKVEALLFLAIPAARNL